MAIICYLISSPHEQLRAGCAAKLSFSVKLSSFAQVQLGLAIQHQLFTKGFLFSLSFNNRNHRLFLCVRQVTKNHSHCKKEHLEIRKKANCESLVFLK